MMEEQPLMGSSRWNPTVEQLLALEEMYRRGTRTPSADQIQQIATQLRRFGKIEGKNVFYWFQNHKARERQKRRREAQTTDPAQTQGNKDSDLIRADFDVEPKKTVSVSSSNCRENLEGPFSMHRAATAESKIINCWSQLEDKTTLHHQKNSWSMQENHTWHAVDLHPTSPTKLINNNNDPTSSSSRFLNFESQKATENKNNEEEEEGQEEGEVETLELFPLCSNEGSNNGSRKNININDTQVPIRAINTKLSPNQYIEFLPLKN